MIGVLLEGNRLNETRQVVKNAKDGLIGFAIKNNRFPCPDIDDDGEEDCPYVPIPPPPPPPSTYKNTKLPYITIGIRGKDPYLNQLYYDVNDEDVNGETLTSTSDGYTFCTVLKNISSPNDPPRITQDEGSNWSSVAAIVLSSSENKSLDSINSDDTNRDYETKGITDNFDDIVEWIDPSSLLAKRGCQEDCSSYTVYNNIGEDIYVQGGISGCREIFDGDMFDVRLGDTVMVYLASDCTDCTCTPINSAVTYLLCQTTDTYEDCQVQSTDAISFTLIDY